MNQNRKENNKTSNFEETTRKGKIDSCIPFFHVGVVGHSWTTKTVNGIIGNSQERGGRDYLEAKRGRRSISRLAAAGTPDGGPAVYRRGSA